MSDNKEILQNTPIPDNATPEQVANPVEVKNDLDEAKTLAETSRDISGIEQQIAVTQNQREIAANAPTVSQTDIQIFDQQVEQNKDKKKGFFEQSKEFVSNHKTLLGRGAAIGGSILLYKWLFKKKKKESTEEGDEKESKEKKKGFWQTGRGKALKRAGIGSGGYYLIHGFATGKWNIGDVFDWTKDTLKDKPQSYIDAMKENPELKEAYEGLGSATDEVYKGIYGKEIASGWRDDADMDTLAEEAGTQEKVKGVVPWMIDQKYTNVDEFLSEQGQFQEIISSNADAVREKISGLLVGVGAASWKWILGRFGFGKTNPSQTFNEWFNEKPQERANEIQKFFRQSMRIQTFLVEKQQQLVEKIAAEKLGILKDKSSLDDALDDSDWLEKNVYKDSRFDLFNKGKLSNAYSVLKAVDIMDGNITDDTRKIVDRLDEERGKITKEVDNKDLLVKGTEELNAGKLEQTTQQGLAEMCNDIVKDMDDELLKAMEESGLNMIGRFCNTDEASKREILEKMNFSGFFQEVKTSMAVVSQKIASGSLTVEELKAFKDVVNSYFAMKKEIFVGANSYQTVKSNSSMEARITLAFADSATNLGKGLKKLATGKVRDSLSYLWTGSLAVVGVGGLVSLKYGKLGKTIALMGVKMAVAPAYLPYKMFLGNRRIPQLFRGIYSGSPGLIRRMYFSGESKLGGVIKSGPQHLLNEFKAGRLSLDQAGRIIDSGQTALGLGHKDTRKLWADMFEAGRDGKTAILRKIYGDIPPKELSLLSKYYDIGDVKTSMKDLSKYSEVIGKLETVEKNVANLSPVKRSLYEELLRQKHINVDKLSMISEQIGKIDDAVFSGVSTKDIAKTLVKNDEARKSADALKDFLEKNKKTTNAASNATAGGASANKPLLDNWNNIDELPHQWQKDVRAGYIDEIAKIETAKKTGMQFGSLADKEIETLKEFSKKVPQLERALGEDILRIVKTGSLDLYFITRLAEEGTDVKQLQKAIAEAVNKNMNLAGSKVSSKSLLGVVMKNNNAESLMKELEKAGASEKFLSQMEKMSAGSIDDLVKLLSKGKSAFAEVAKIITKIGK